MKHDIDTDALMFIGGVLFVFILGYLSGCELSRDIHRDGFVNKICLEKQYDFCKAEVTYSYQKN